MLDLPSGDSEDRRVTVVVAIYELEAQFSLALLGGPILSDPRAAHTVKFCRILSCMPLSPST